MLLETERLILRPIEETDIPDLFPLINDEDVTRNLMSVTYPYPLEAYAPWIRKCREAMERREQFDLAIVLKETGKAIGAFGLSSISWDHMRAEIGYWIGKPHWGKGYTTEAARRMTEFGFHELGLERIYAYCFIRNIASQRVLEKTGLKREGMLKHAIKKAGEFHDLYEYAVIREEFSARP